MRLIVVLILILAVAVVGIGTFWAGSGVPGLGSSSPLAVQAPDTAPKAQAQKGEVSVEITEAELTQRLSQQLAGRSLGQTPLGAASVERLETSLRSGRAEVSGNARLGGASVPYTSQLTAAPDPAGRVQVRLADAKVGGVAVPESARADLESVMQSEVNRLLATQPMRVRSLEIGDGRMRIIGSPG